MEASYNRDHKQVSRATSKIKGSDRARKAIEVRPHLFHREKRMVVVMVVIVIEIMAAIHELWTGNWRWCGPSNMIPQEVNAGFVGPGKISLNSDEITGVFVCAWTMALVEEIMVCTASGWWQAGV